MGAANGSDNEFEMEDLGGFGFDASEGASATDARSDAGSTVMDFGHGRRDSVMSMPLGGGRTSPTGSQGSSIVPTDDALRDFVMLQHVLLRAFSVNVLPAYLASPGYVETLRELRNVRPRLAIHSLLEVRCYCRYCPYCPYCPY